MSQRATTLVATLVTGAVGEAPVGEATARDVTPTATAASEKGKARIKKLQEKRQ
jgi:hypothetical protein